MGGDCNDDDDRVSPEPTPNDYQPSAYTAPSGSESFDYDCSGTEESDPTQLGAAPDCSLLTLNCAGRRGYLPTGRSGAGINPLCGSTTVRLCVAAALGCSAATESVLPHRCR